MHPDPKHHLLMLDWLRADCTLNTTKDVQQVATPQCWLSKWLGEITQDAFLKSYNVCCQWSLFTVLFYHFGGLKRLKNSLQLGVVIVSTFLYVLSCVFLFLECSPVSSRPCWIHLIFLCLFLRFARLCFFFLFSLDISSTLSITLLLFYSSYLVSNFQEIFLNLIWSFSLMILSSFFTLNIFAILVVLCFLVMATVFLILAFIFHPKAIPQMSAALWKSSCSTIRYVCLGAWFLAQSS